MLCYHSSSAAEDGEERGTRDTAEDGEERGPADIPEDGEERGPRDTAEDGGDTTEEMGGREDLKDEHHQDQVKNPLKFIGSSSPLKHFNLLVKLWKNWEFTFLS